MIMCIYSTYNMPYVLREHAYISKVLPPCPVDPEPALSPEEQTLMSGAVPKKSKKGKKKVDLEKLDEEDESSGGDCDPEARGSEDAVGRGRGRGRGGRGRGRTGACKGRGRGRGQGSDPEAVAASPRAESSKRPSSGGCEDSGDNMEAECDQHEEKPATAKGQKKADKAKAKAKAKAKPAKAKAKAKATSKGRTTSTSPKKKASKKQKQEAEYKKKLSRKSSAYHKAKQEALKKGLSPEEVREAARKVTVLALYACEV